MEPKDAFFDTIKLEFAPRLRDVGFKGSGRNFRRVSNEIIHAVNLQTWKYGGRCALNIGLHATFLPIFYPEELPDVSRIKEMNCEFRGRVSPNPGADYWWDFGKTPESACRSARYLADTYFDVAEPKFDQVRSTKALVEWLTLEATIRGDYLVPFKLTSICRALLAMARTHQHQGDITKAKEFAAEGLSRVDRAISLIPHFESILNASS